MPAESDNLAAARGYLAAIEQGATGDALAAFFCEDVVHEEFPNRLTPRGAKSDLRAILAAADRGQRVLAGQHYELVHAVAAGDCVALEAVWTGTLAAPVGPLPAGAAMRARFAVFLWFRDGKIVRQHNYDCFDPF
jgi:ketosteroid isomerase-like protein